jgi:SSS family solute:Na+ symporter
MTIVHYIGVILVLLLIAFVGAYSGKKVSSASDFSTGGGKAGSWIVAGTIMGTLMSGQATIGTAQLAFNFGLSAWWFTLGSGIGCLLLGLAYAAPLRDSGSKTLLGVISAEYGHTAGYIGSVLSSLGIFISVLAQVVSATAMISIIFPVSIPVAGLISVGIMAFYVIFGGVWGAGMGGVVKLILLYIVSIIGWIIVWHTAGPSELIGNLKEMLVGTPLGSINGIDTSDEVVHQFLSLTARGAMKDIGSGLSLILGVLSTQTYSQAIWSGSSNKVARKGALLSAFMIPPVGIAGIFIGMFMRTQCITAAEIQAITAAGQAVPLGLIELTNTAQVFPAFVINYMPGLLGGVTLGTLLITVVGGGSGLSLGVATIIVHDLIEKRFKSLKDSALELVLIRATIALVLLISVGVMLSTQNSFINDLGFLSMGLRASVIFIPICCSLWLKGRIDAVWAQISIIAGPVTVIVGNLLKWSFNPLFISIGVCLLIMMIGFAAGKRKPLYNH